MYNCLQVCWGRVEYMYFSSEIIQSELNSDVQYMYHPMELILQSCLAVTISN